MSEEATRKRPCPSKEANSSGSRDDDSLQLQTRLQIPPELRTVDFTRRVSWGKYHPYSDKTLPFVKEDETVNFGKTSSALCCSIHAICGRARATTLHLRRQPGQETKSVRPVPTPIFMPVGTKGCLKGVEISELLNDQALSCPIILANTYHLAIQPGTELVDGMGGLHTFQGLPCTSTNKSYNLLTDSGGFQMVSLVKLSEVTEDGVSFENPFKKDVTASSKQKEKDILLLRPEDSMRHQNNIGANIIMALDDVVSR